MCCPHVGARWTGIAQCGGETMRTRCRCVMVLVAAVVAFAGACAAQVATTPSGTPKGTSMHGWGKAADFLDAGGSVAFGSPGYQFLTAAAGRFGWNHPGWARPGGSACPEAWHWEWVGDGGIQHDSPIRADVVAILPAGDGRGYATVTGLGTLARHGDAIDAGSLAGHPLSWLVVGGALTADGRGYWLVGSDGGVCTFGDARYFGSTGSAPPSQPIVGMAPSRGGAGYWLAAADGRIFAFGDARSYGSPAASSLPLARPVVAMAATPDGRGYW